MLTKKQRQVLDFIKKYKSKKKYEPSLEEIKKHFRLASVSTAHFHVKKLEKFGYLRKEENQPRAIEVFKHERMIKIPLLGKIAAGQPIEAIGERESIAVPQNKIPINKGIYALRVVGNSMIEENVNDGDIILVKHQKTAENGQKIVALIDNHEVTFKKFYKEKKYIRLQPANKAIEPIIINNKKNIAIQGIVIDVIPNLETNFPIVFPLRNEIYPNTQSLNAERKVKNRIEKEKIRGGTKFQKQSIVIEQKKEINKFTNKIICGDSEKELKKIPADSIDIIITSPPYNFGLSYKDDHKNDSVHWQEYFIKLNNVWKECVRVLKPGGRLCVNIQPLFSDYIPTHHLISKQLIDLGLMWKGEILWEKNNYNCKYTAWGSWKSPSMPYLKYTWEFIEIFSKKTHKKIGNASDIDITGDEFKKWVYAKWSIAPERNMKEYDHPAMFPKELAYRLLKLLSYKNDIVLDPFNGAGTTTACAIELCRKYIGIDISKKYCRTAEKRIKELPQKLL